VYPSKAEGRLPLSMHVAVPIFTSYYSHDTILRHREVWGIPQMQYFGMFITHYGGPGRRITPRQTSPPWRFPLWCCSGFYTYTISPSMREYPNTIASLISPTTSRVIPAQAGIHCAGMSAPPTRATYSITYEQARSVRFPPKAEARSSSGLHRLHTSSYWVSARSRLQQARTSQVMS
jgi:hypothetical protein